jgi:predicted O-linked N-acetylglucosamine transferase (SPINDLY family)
MPPLVVNALLGNLKFMQLYFSDRNLKDFYEKRGRIIDWGLRRLGLPVDHTSKPRQAGAPVKLGIVFEDMASGPELHCSLPLLEHVAANFEVTVYTIVMTCRIEQFAINPRVRFVALPQAIRAQVDTIRGDGPDIVLFASNITLYSSHVSYLAAHRLAPVQVASIASVVTSGLRHVDHFISSQWLESGPAPQEHYTEDLILLPDVAHGFSFAKPVGQPARPAPARTPMAVEPGDVVFTSTANMFKLVPELIDTYLRILQRSERTKMVLFPFGPNWSSSYPKQAFAEHCGAAAAALGIDRTRLRIVDSAGCSRTDIREVMRGFHIFLDSFPFSGAATAIEPLELGMPVVSMGGVTMRANLVASLLRALDVPELVAPDIAGYIDLACRLAAEPETRAGLSARIKQAMAATPSFLNGPLYARRMYDLFGDMAGT